MTRSMHVAKTEKVLLKDQLFNKVKVERLAREIEHVYPSFERAAFVREVMAGFPARELKARISWMTACLRKYLPNRVQKGRVGHVKGIAGAMRSRPFR